MREGADVLVHLCTAEEWAEAQRLGAHRPPSLTEVGFVHLSSPQQIHLPANRLYAERAPLESFVKFRGI